MLPLALALLILLVLPARAVSDAAILGDTPPRQLSAFGFFTDLPSQIPAEGVVPFALNTPLYSDGAVKRRFAYVPAGKAAAYDAAEAFDFPVGSALIKTFAFPADERAPNERLRLIETRVLLRQEDGWHAWAYLWDEAQTDATLKIAGAKVDVTLVGPDGEPVAFGYAVPNKNQCKGCHALGDALVPLGPKARNLNGAFAYADGAANQIDRWAALGMLTGTPQPAEIPVAPGLRDADAPLAARARAWLDVNCAHCHRAEGPASNSGLFLDWHESDPIRLGVMKRPVAAGRGAGDRAFDIVPGKPDESILLYRVESVEPGVMMPELGRHRADPDGAALLRAWIATLEPPG